MANTYKVLGQTNPSTTSNTNLYTVPSGTSAVISSFVVVNTTDTAAMAHAYIRVVGAPATSSNEILHSATIAANSTAAFTLGITMGAGDIITVRSDTTNAIAYHAFGTEIN